MRITTPPDTTRSIALPRKTLVAAIAALALCQTWLHAGPPVPTGTPASMRGNAGTTFTLAPVFDDQQNPVFPWFHEVRGVVQFSNLGNCTVRFDIRIDGGNACSGGHAYCLSGTLTITTLTGDQIHGVVVGWGDPDPKDPSQTGAMNLLHYDVSITGGTGQFTGASGRGRIDGAFFFCGADCFGDQYAGVATWTYQGTLHPAQPRR